jgi:hypothetical protein
MLGSAVVATFVMNVPGAKRRGCGFRQRKEDVLTGLRLRRPLKRLPQPQLLQLENFVLVSFCFFFCILHFAFVCWIFGFLDFLVHIFSGCPFYWRFGKGKE